MSSLIVGDVLTQGFATASPGESFTIQAQRDPDGLAFFSLADITDLGGGDYQLTFAPTKVGNYYLHLVGQTSGQDIIGNWDVDPAPQPVSQPQPNTAGTTLGDLRLMVALNTKDGLELTATAAGTTTTFKDSLNLYEDINAFRGAEIVFTSGVNKGQVRRIAGSDRETATITIAGAALPAQTQPGDTAQLYNLRGHGFRIAEIDRAINTAISTLYPVNRVYASEVLADLYVANDRTITIPAKYTYLILSQIAWLDSSGEWRMIRPAAPGGHGVWTNPDGTAELGGNVRWWADGRSLRIAGYTRPAKLVAETDLTTTDPEWLTAQATALLLLGMRREENMAWGQYWFNIADSIRPKETPGAANTVKIRD